MSASAPARGETKWSRILRALVNGRRLTRYEAEALGDHTLNTTISILRRRHGVSVQREVVVIDGNYGRFWCARYWLDREGKARAQRLLAQQ